MSKEITTKDIEQTIVCNGYAGTPGRVEFKIGEEWYRIKTEDLHNIITSTKLPLVATLARKYQYLAIKEQ